MRMRSSRVVRASLALSLLTATPALADTPVSGIRYHTRAIPTTTPFVGPHSPAQAASDYAALSDGTIGYGCTILKGVENVNNTLLFGAEGNVAYYIETDMTVPTGSVGTWGFRYGADFGYGGTLMVDGVALQSNWSDFYWMGSWADPTQYLSGSVTLTGGPHTLEIYGFEDCCDGLSELEVEPPGGTWQVLDSTVLPLTTDTCGSLLPSVSAWAPGFPGTGVAVPGSNVIFDYSASEDLPDGMTALQPTFSAFVPPGTTFVSASDGGSYNAATNFVTWVFGDLAPVSVIGATLTVNVSPSLSTGDSFSSTVIFSDDAGYAATATATYSVSGSPALKVAATPTPTLVAAGGDVSIEVDYSNTGKGGATGMQLTAVLPVGVTFVSATQGGVFSSGQISWNVGTVPASGSGSVTFVVKVGSGESPGTALSFQGTLTPTGLRYSTSVTVSGPTLSVSGSAVPAPASPSLPVTFTLVATNPYAFSPSAQSVVLTASVPPGTTFASVTGGGSFNAGTGLVTWALGTLAPLQSVSVTFTATVSAALASGDVFDSSLTLTDAASDLATATVPVSVNGTPGLQLAATPTPALVAPGANLSVELDYGNNGTGAADGVVLTLPLPANATFVSAVDNGSYNPGTNQITWALGTLPVAGSGSVTCVVQVASGLAGGTLLAAQGTLTSSNAGSAEATASATVSGQTLAIQANASPNPAQPTLPVTFAIVASNPDSYSPTAQAVALTAVVPPRTTFDSATGGGVFDSSTNLVTWTLGTLVPLQSVDLTMTVDVSAALASGDSFASTLTLTDAANDLASTVVSVTVSGTPGLQLAATPSPAVVTPGGILSIELDYGNNGTGAADGAELTAALPANTTFVSINDNGNYDPIGKQVSWTLGAVPVGSSGSVTFVVQVASPLANGTVIPVQGILSSSNQGSLPANASATVGGPTLSLVSSGSPNPVAPGGILDFALAYGNPGAGDAFSVVLTDAVPLGTTLLDAGRGNYDSATGMVTWTLGTLAAGGAGQVDMLVALPANTTDGTAEGDSATLTAQNATAVVGQDSVTVEGATTVGANGTTSSATAGSTGLSGTTSGASGSTSVGTGGSIGVATSGTASSTGTEGGTTGVATNGVGASTGTQGSTTGVATSGVASTTGTESSTGATASTTGATHGTGGVASSSSASASGGMGSSTGATNGANAAGIGTASTGNGGGPGSIGTGTTSSTGTAVAAGGCSCGNGGDGALGLVGLGLIALRRRRSMAASHSGRSLKGSR